MTPPPSSHTVSGATEYSGISADDDAEDDDGESVRLSFGTTLPDRVTSASPSATTINIADNDDPEVDISFERASYIVDEGSAQTIKVTLSADPEPTLDIPLSTSTPGDTSENDYSGVPTSVTFSRGQTEKTFRFSATNDDMDDDNDSVEITFGSLPNRVDQGAHGLTTVNIRDDDGNDSATTTHSVSGYGSVTTAADVSVTITNDEAPSVEVGFQYCELRSCRGQRSVGQGNPERGPKAYCHHSNQLNATNLAGASDDDNSGVPSEVTFDIGETTMSFTFAATQDNMNDDDEGVRLSFGALPDYVTEGSNGAAVVSITDDDGAGVMVNPKSLTVDEGSPDQVIFTETDTCQETALGNVKAWVYTAEGEREHEVWSIHPLEISFTLTKDQVEDFGGLGVLFQTYAIGGIVVQGSDRLPGRWNDIRPTFFDANPDGGVTAYAMTRYFSPTI